MNSTSAVEGDEFSEGDQNLNKVASLPIMMSQERTQYHSSLLFEGDNDDEVFEDYQETTSMIMSREPRVRRISDVIDSIGCSPSSPISRSSSNFDFSEKTVTEESICIVRREEVKYIDLQTPPKGRRGLQSVTDSLLSETPPTTPTSDLGYCSAGLQTSPTNMVFKPKWYRFSASSDHSSPPKQDMMDAQIMCAPTESQEKPMETTEPNEKSSGFTPIVYPKAKMPVSIKSLEYNMDHPRMGHAIIFNHEEFLVDNTPPRVGSKLDAIRLSETLKALGFMVTIYHDLDSEKIKMRINELAAMDHGDCNCVLVAVLSHGMGTSYILSHDYPYPIDMLWTPFMPDRCDTLAGKPKIFLIQACRGDKLDGGVHLVSNKNRTQTDSDTQNYKIPAMADFLLAYSTAEGFYSWRNPLKGTWFIQSLCDVLESEAFNHDFQTLLLMVAQKVALHHESYSDLYPWQHQQKQVPQTVSTLIRKIFFKQNP